MNDQPVVVENYFTDEEVEIMLYHPTSIQKPTQMPFMGGAYGFETSAAADSLSMTNPVSPLTGDPKTDESILKFTEAVLAVKKEVEKFFGLEMSITNCNYMYMQPGAENGLHADTCELDGSRFQEEEEETEYSALIYLSESGKDFEGGDIYFPLQDLVIAPKRGTIIYFKGDHHRPHGVTKVTKGERRVVVLFFGPKGKVSNKVLFSGEHSGVFEN